MRSYWNISALNSPKSFCTDLFANKRASEWRLWEVDMSDRFFVATGVVAVAIAVALAAPGNVAGQTDSTLKAVPGRATASAKPWTPPRTPDGQPDLQGVWDYRTITPLERPKELGTKAFFTEEEAAKYEKTENQRQNRDLIDPEQGGSLYPPGGVIPYNEFWYDRGDKVTGAKRT